MSPSHSSTAYVVGDNKKVSYPLLKQEYSYSYFTKSLATIYRDSEASFLLQNLKLSLMPLLCRAFMAHFWICTDQSAQEKVNLQLTILCFYMLFVQF